MVNTCSIKHQVRSIYLHLIYLQFKTAISVLVLLLGLRHRTQCRMRAARECVQTESKLEISSKDIETLSFINYL